MQADESTNPKEVNHSGHRRQVPPAGLGAGTGSTRWGVGRVRHRRAAVGGRTEAEKQKNGYWEVVAIKKQKMPRPSKSDASTLHAFAQLYAPRARAQPSLRRPPERASPGGRRRPPRQSRHRGPRPGAARNGRGAPPARAVLEGGGHRHLRADAVEPARRSRASPAASLPAGRPPMARSNGTSGAAALGGCFSFPVATTRLLRHSSSARRSLSPKGLS